VALNGPEGLGRTDLLRALATRIGSAAGALVLVEGEPGVGKTRLLTDLGRRVPDVHRVVVPTRRYDVRPAGGLLDALGLGLPARDPGRRSPLETPAPPHSAVVDLVRSAVRVVAESGTTVVVVDDLHWSDPDTLGALGALVDLTSTLPLSLLLARRPAPRSPALDALVERCRDADAEVVRLGGLPEPEVVELAGQLVGGRPGPRLRKRLVATGGNPFLVEQLLAQARRTRLLHDLPDGSVELSTPESLPDGSAVLRRMVDLEERASLVLRALALLDGQASYAELAAATGRDALDLVEPVQRCREAGVVVEDGEGLRISHELVREAVEADLPPGSVPELRRTIGHRLLDAGAAPDRVAAQFLRSGRGLDHAAAGVLTAVAGSMVGRAPASAVDLFERAVALAGHVGPEATAAQVGLVDALFWSGRPVDALALADRLRGDARPASRLAADETGIRCLTILGRPAEALDRARAMPREPGSVAWTEALTAAMAMFALELAEAETRATTALAACETHPDRFAEVLAWSVRAWVLNLGGYHADAVEPAATAVRLADESAHGAAHRMAPRLFHGLALESAGDSAAASETLQHGLVIADDLGARWAVPFYRYAVALGHWNAGRWSEAEHECREGLRIAAEQGIALAAPWAHAVLAGVAVHAGALDRAAAHLDDGDRAIAAGGVQVGLDWLTWIRALHLEALGQPEAAYDLLVQAWGLAEAVHANAALTLFGPDLVRMSVLAGQLDTARDVVAAMAAASRAGRVNVDAHVDRCRGLVEGDLSLVARAREVHAAGGRPVEVRLDDEATVLLLLRGGAPEAGERLRAVVADCAAAGMVRVADRLELAARGAGVAPGEQRIDAGWEALTPTELRVAALVASGRTNAEVAVALGASVRTVESHLYRTYAKLGVKNRTELALAHHQRSPGE
jgi:DNA-binding CsgD family transcriptional regulator/tetratricopeptide (TPR) repeat protein